MLKGNVSIKDVVDIISSYTDNGYRWFRLEFVVPVGVFGHAMDWENLNQEIIWNLEYDDDDYFRSNEYYKGVCPAKSKAVSFADWRNELEAKYMKGMSDTDLARFVASLIDPISVFLSLSHHFEESINWIAHLHK